MNFANGLGWGNKFCICILSSIRDHASTRCPAVGEKCFESLIVQKEPRRMFLPTRLLTKVLNTLNHNKAVSLLAISSSLVCLEFTVFDQIYLETECV